MKDVGKEQEEIEEEEEESKEKTLRLTLRRNEEESKSSDLVLTFDSHVERHTKRGPCENRSLLHDNYTTCRHGALFSFLFSLLFSSSGESESLCQPERAPSTHRPGFSCFLYSSSRVCVCVVPT